MLEIKNLHAAIDGKEILKGVDLMVAAGEVHAIMGPNGSGKSTLSYVLAGRDGYDVTQGSITFNGKDLLDMKPEGRAAAGVFLAFQYPVEIPGVSNINFLKTSLNAIRKSRGESELDAMQMLKLLRGKAKALGMTEDMLKRAVNTGFSGGEKKRNEVLQMTVLEPALCILDETDSGLDIDALKIVADGVNALRSKDRAMLIITHYQRLLDYIKPDRVHVLAQGKIQKSGDAALALELEAKGYADFCSGCRVRNEMSLASVIERSEKEREAWKYTSLKSLGTLDFAAAAPRKMAPADLILPSIVTEKAQRHQIVFVNGERREDLSQLHDLPADIIAGTAKDGYRLTLAGRTCLVTVPVELVFITAAGATPTEFSMRLRIELGASGRLTLIEHHVALDEAPFAAIMETEIHLGPQAKLVHGKNLQGAAKAVHFAQTRVDVSEGAYYDSFKLLRGGRVTRDETEVVLQGKLAQCVLNGAMLARGQEHIDTTTRITHAAPNCSSREIYKSVVDGKAHAVFQGKILVEKNAQKTDGHQLCRALLLSDQAEMDAKPELEIYADDVKCSHGCSIGDLDGEALFYMRARGLSENEARSLLIHGFVEEILDEIRVGEWRDYCKAQTEEWLNVRG